MNVILPILLITSLLHSISSQSSTSSSGKKKKEYDNADKDMSDVDTSEHNPNKILDPPSSSLTRIYSENFKPMDLNNIASYDEHLRQYQSRVVEQLKNEMCKHNRMPSNFTFSPYLSMSAALHKIESRHFAKFLARKVREGYEDADQIGRKEIVDGLVKMKDIRRIAFKVKDHYEKPRGNESQGTHFPNYNLAFDVAANDLGVNNWNAEGNLVKVVEPKGLFSLDNIGKYHKYLQQYDESVSRELKEELLKDRVKGKFYQISPYLNMAAAYYGISIRRFVQFLAYNIVRKNMRNDDQIMDEVWVVRRVRMDHLREAARKIKEHYEGGGGAGPSSSGSRSGV